MSITDGTRGLCLWGMRMSNAAAFATGLHAILASRIELSAPTAVFLDVALRAADDVAGAAIETLSQEALQAMPTELVGAVGSALSSAVMAFPIVGQFVGVVAGILGNVAETEARALHPSERMVTALVPAFNEAATGDVVRVLWQSRQFGDVVVVDGSSDGQER